MRNYFKGWFGGNKEVLKQEPTAEQKKADDISGLAKMMGYWYDEYRMHMGRHVSDRALSDSTEDRIAKFITINNFNKQDIQDAWSLARPPLPESEFNMFEHMIFQAKKRLEQKEAKPAGSPNVEEPELTKEELDAIRRQIDSIGREDDVEKDKMVGVG